MVGPHREVPALQMMTEMTNSCKDSEQFPIKSTVCLLSCLQFRREEPQGPPVGGGGLSLLQHCSNMCGRSICCQSQFCCFFGESQAHRLE